MRPALSFSSLRKSVTIAPLRRLQGRALVPKNQREEEVNKRINRGLAAVLFLSLAAVLAGTPASAQTKLRVGKAQAQTFAFAPADVGVETGIFKKHGLDVEISAFGGDARMLQALSADALDIALGGGPALAFVVKGTPMLAVAALADAPRTIML